MPEDDGQQMTAAGVVEASAIHVLHFRLCDEHFCMELKHVQQVFPLMALQHMPDSVDCLLGLMNLHGKCIPVLDFAMLLGLEHPQQYDLNASAVLCNAAGQKVVFIADDLFDVQCVDGQTVQLKKIFKGDMPPFLGVIRINHDMALWLNPEPMAQVLARPEMQDILTSIEAVRPVITESGTDA